METESGAKIAIRGKGSVKEGKGRSDAAHTSNQEEDLHCLIMADTEEKVNKAKKLIHNVIETVSCALISPFTPVLTLLQAASIPEGQNELKRNQLRELAALNGTLRDDENQACQNCGQIGHRKYDCPEKQNFTANIICRVCGNAGHMARDCPDRQRGADWRNDRGGFGGRSAGRIEAGPDSADMAAFMADIGGVAGGAPARIEAGPGGGDMDAPRGGRGGAKPWERGPTGGPAPWQQSNRDRDGGSGGGPAPWQSGGGGGGGGRSYDNYGGGGGYGGGYGSGGHGGAAPWQQQNHAQMAPQSGYNGYGYSAPGYDQSGYGAAPPPWGASGYGNAGSPPPPPPGGDAPPPPVSFDLHYGYDTPNIPQPPSGDAPPPPPPGA